MNTMLLPLALLMAGWTVPAFAGVDPGLLALVVSDARALAGIQVDQAQSTPIVQSLLAKIQLDPGPSKAMAAIGFDPRRDLKELLLVSLGAGAYTQGGSGILLLLGRGSFHPLKIAAAGASAGSAVSTYRGVVLIESKGNGSGTGVSGSVAFLDASTMVAGDAAEVKAAIDRHASGAVYSGDLAAPAREISAGNDAWLVVLTPPAGTPAAAALSATGSSPFLIVLQSALQISAGLKLTPAVATISADIVARSPQDAQSMVDLLKFAIQVAQGKSLTDAARVTAAGSTMYLVISGPERELERLLLATGGPAPGGLAK